MIEVSQGLRCSEGAESDLFESKFACAVGGPEEAGLIQTSKNLLAICNGWALR